MLSYLFPPVCQLCPGERAGRELGYVGPACRQAVRWICPPFCQQCGLPFAGEVTTEFACANCADERWYFSYARAAVEAKGPVLEAIHRFKYQRALWFRVWLSELLLSAASPVLKRDPAGWHGVVPVPLHPVKRREREFNQAELLGAALAGDLGVRLETGLVHRIHPTETQTTLSREARAENVRQAFIGPAGHSLVNRRLVVVDDVFTTGATTNAVARVLRDAGAAEVVVWAVARGI